MDWRALQDDPVLNGYDNHPSIAKRHIKKSVEIDNDREAWGDSHHRPDDENSHHHDKEAFMMMDELDQHHARRQAGDEEEMNDGNEYSHMHQHQQRSQHGSDSDGEDDNNEYYRTHQVDEAVVAVPGTSGHGQSHDDLKHIQDQHMHEDQHDHIEHDQEHIYTHTPPEGDEDIFFEEGTEENNWQEPWEEIVPWGMEMETEDIEIIEVYSFFGYRSVPFCLSK